MMVFQSQLRGNPYHANGWLESNNKTSNGALFLCPGSGAGAIYIGRWGAITRDDWYSNKELYEMQVRLSKRMEGLSGELATTQTMIRDYNGLRERLNECEQRINDAAGAGRGGREMWGYVAGGIGVLLALISYAAR